MKIKIVLSLSLILCLCVVANAQKKTTAAAKTDAPKSAVKVAAAPSDASSRKQIDAFNDELKAAIMSMDNARVMAMWDEEGSDLLPGQEAVSGKANIAKWLDGVTDKMKGWKVVSQDNEFHDIQIHGDWASEWATTKQVSQPPEGKKFVGIGKSHGPVTAVGKMLLVLKRGSDGKWKIREEAWVGNQ